MKYWRGYLVAAILAACTWAFREFAESHSKLVDMVYPYITRMIQNFMAGWSGGVEFCLWQTILLALVVLAVASIVLMLVLRWNPIEWFGWVLSVVSLILLLHTGIFGMNEFAGPIAEDIRLMEVEVDDQKMEEAAVYFRDQAGALSGQVTGTANLATLNEKAIEGFDTLVYDRYLAVFAGAEDPVKELGMAQWFTQRGEMGFTVAITGEAALNPETPAFMQPFAVCRELCYRRCIASQRDKHFGAFMVAQANTDPEFQYAAYVMAYRYCLNALPETTASIVNAQANSKVKADVETWNEFVAPAEALAAEKAQKEGLVDTTNTEIAELLVRWQYQEIVIPSITEPEKEFDPMDETQVDLTGLPHADAAKNPVEETLDEYLEETDEESYEEDYEEDYEDA